ncbi:hypothetical protein FOZ63_013182 [Perkinsus olseni]|uniref:subtilisin n=1 Tax=Perkinsus olseni TaxID=32597 RepID=A0A7J6SGI8_PEROL|nr:hypothetical protein FOZ63_013182 [Perkinsus olseni]
MKMVLDSGINWTDPDFAPLKGRVKKTSGGYLEGGWNFNTESSNLTTESSHGTHVCKVLAAKGNNSYGLVGIAPNVTLVPLQVVKIVKGKDTVPLVNFVAALNMAIDIKADIISMSVGFYPHQMTPSTLYLMWRALRSAQLAGILLVSSAGNKGVRALNKYPCWFGGPLGMCVANLLSNQTHNVLNPNSNWGERVDVAAYGTKIVVDGGKETLTITSGSSVAAPFATGISAILLSMGVKPGKVKPFIRMHTDPIYHPPNAGQPHTIRGGALNALKTAKFAINWLDSKPRELRSNDYLELEG